MKTPLFKFSFENYGYLCHFYALMCDWRMLDVDGKQKK